MLDRAAIAADHVESTSVPGLAAKDCIDVQFRVAALDDRTWPTMAQIKAPATEILIRAAEMWAAQTGWA